MLMPRCAAMLCLPLLFDAAAAICHAIAIYADFFFFDAFFFLMRLRHFAASAPDADASAFAAMPHMPSHTTPTTPPATPRHADAAAADAAMPIRRRRDISPRLLADCRLRLFTDYSPGFLRSSFVSYVLLCFRCCLLRYVAAAAAMLMSFLRFLMLYAMPFSDADYAAFHAFAEVDFLMPPVYTSFTSLLR